jgi:peptidoglycan/xylan/chitin deacetylase (PgdA/CDA1 family)
MDAAGFSVESHTVTHPILTNVPDGQLRRELCDSRARLADELRRTASLFCYPNGDEDARVRREVARAGYRAAVTTRPGLNGRASDPFALRRVHTEDDLAHFAQSTSGFESIKERLRRGGAANAAAAELS